MKMSGLNLGDVDWIIMAILVPLFGVVIRYLIKSRKNGVTCVGCSHSGGCLGCSCTDRQEADPKEQLDQTKQ